MRLKDLYDMVGKNQVCILPDPNIRCKDGMPSFTIFTSDFKKVKKFRKFKNTYMAGDVNKQSCEFMADILKPEINKIKLKNKRLTQSRSILQNKLGVKNILNKKFEDRRKSSSSESSSYKNKANMNIGIYIKERQNSKANITSDGIAYTSDPFIIKNQRRNTKLMENYFS